MKSSKLERIAELLSRDDLQSDEDNVQFCITDELASTDINIEVDGLGIMTLPVSDEYIQKLINISSKAQFGLREQTILDENFRNCYEITSDKLCTTINEQSLTSMLSKMRNSLGLSENSVLTAHLHNMLIYGPGMFFERHQDSEKLENMVASLVVVLPSPHIGGDLVIEHGTKNHVFSSENVKQSNVKCIGFYADCHHKVEKIKDGYRIALTYNLVLKPEEISSRENVNANQQLLEAVKDYFDVEENKQFQYKQLCKLVYFLDHSYTEHSLRWSMLKGEDRTSASALLKVAKELSLISHLALVEIHERWSAGGPDAYDVDDFIDEEVTLSYWVDSNNKKVMFDACDIGDDEICYTAETYNFEPYKKQYEGYTGNAGNTMDYWYRRAAIVLWSESSHLLMNFILNYDNALNELKVLANNTGNEKKVMEIIAKAGQYLYSYKTVSDKNTFETLAIIGLYIKDKDIALPILSHFQWKILNSDISESFAKLQIQYGINWCINLINKWKKKQVYSKDFSIKEIHTFVQNFVSYGGAASIVEMLLDIQTNTLMDISQGAHKWLPKEYLPKKLDMCYQTFRACAAVNNTSVVDKIIQYLISNPKLYPVNNLARLYFKLQDVVPSEFFSNYHVLRSYLIKTIDSTLALKKRPNDDWSIDVEFQCECSHCLIAMSFLHSKTERTRIWPISKATRAHIYNKFSGLDLPVQLSTQRTGSPFKLVMVKTELLHQNVKKVHDELRFYQQKFQTEVKD